MKYVQDCELWSCDMNSTLVSIVPLEMLNFTVFRPLQSCQRHMCPFWQLIRRMRRHNMTSKNTKTETKACMHTYIRQIGIQLQFRKLYGKSFYLLFWWICHEIPLLSQYLHNVYTMLTPYLHHFDKIHTCFSNTLWAIKHSGSHSHFSFVSKIETCSYVGFAPAVCRSFPPCRNSAVPLPQHVAGDLNNRETAWALRLVSLALFFILDPIRNFICLHCMISYEQR